MKRMGNAFEDLVGNFNIQDCEKFSGVAPFNDEYCDPLYFEKGRRYPNYEAVNGVYGIFEDDKCLYVGQSINGVAKRLKQHYHDNQWCQDLIETRKCKLRLLYKFNTKWTHDTDRFLLDAIESYFIYLYKEKGEANYNQHMNTEALKKRNQKISNLNH